MTDTLFKDECIMKKEILVHAMVIVFLAGATLFLQGCIAVAFGAGLGTAAYVTGELEDAVPQTLDQVHQATIKALEGLEFTVTQAEKDALSSTIVARDAKDRRIRVNLSRTEVDSTRISIRVGTFGDEEVSRVIYKRISEALD